MHPVKVYKKKSWEKVQWFRAISSRSTESVNATDIHNSHLSIFFMRVQAHRHTCGLVCVCVCVCE